MTARSGEDGVGPAPVQPVPVDVAELFAAHRLSLVRLAILFVDDQSSAEDVVQEAFIALCRRATSLRDPNAALSYLRTSVVNGCRSTLRRRRTRRAHLDTEAFTTGPTADSEVLIAEEHRRVLEAVRSLPRRQREVLLLRYWSDLSEADIARTLGIAVGTVKSNASRGLDHLKNQLGGSL